MAVDSPMGSSSDEAAVRLERVEDLGALPKVSQPTPASCLLRPSEFQTLLHGCAREKEVRLGKQTSMHIAIFYVLRRVRNSEAS